MKGLTTDELIHEMSGIKGWFIEDEKKIRINIEGHHCCPITAVCYITTDIMYALHKSYNAGKQLGINDINSGIIVAAADDNSYGIMEYREDSMNRLRQRMLEVAGLS